MFQLRHRRHLVLTLVTTSLLGAALAACGGVASPLTGETWSLDAVTDKNGWLTAFAGPDFQGDYTLRFDANGTYTGRADCNAISGDYKMKPEQQLVISPNIATTMVACPPGSHAAQFTFAVTQITSWAVQDARLSLTLGNGAVMEMVPLATVASPEPTLPPMPTPQVIVITPAPADSVAPTASPTPKPKPTPTPTPKPTPTPRPTAAPTPTPAPTAVALGESCSTTGGISVDYPTGWFTVGPETPTLTCAAFGPAPIEIGADGRPANAEVLLGDFAGVAYADALAAAQDPQLWSEVKTAASNVSGLPATVVSAVATGNGTLAAGTPAYSYIIDRGSVGTVILNTTTAEDRAIVDAMASTMLMVAPR